MRKVSKTQVGVLERMPSFYQHWMHGGYSLPVMHALHEKDFSLYTFRGLQEYVHVPYKDLWNPPYQFNTKVQTLPII